MNLAEQELTEAATKAPVIADSPVIFAHTLTAFKIAVPAETPCHLAASNYLKGARRSKGRLAISASVICDSSELTTCFPKKFKTNENIVRNL